MDALKRNVYAKRQPAANKIHNISAHQLSVVTKHAVNKNVYFIKLSNFWNKNIRYSLLTLLIRSALKNKNLVDFDQLIDNNRYLKQTKDALCLFFSGNTEYKGKNKSWYKQFKRMKTDECCKFLHKM